GVRPDSKNETHAFFPTQAVDATGPEKSQSIHTTLLKRYAAYLAAKKAVMNGLAARPNDPNLTAAQPLLEDTATSLHAQLQEHGLEETSPLVGELRTGPV